MVNSGPKGAQDSLATPPVLAPPQMVADKGSGDWDGGGGGAAAGGREHVTLTARVGYGLLLVPK